MESEMKKAFKAFLEEQKQKGASSSKLASNPVASTLGPKRPVQTQATSSLFASSTSNASTSKLEPKTQFQTQVTANPSKSSSSSSSSSSTKTSNSTTSTLAPKRLFKTQVTASESKSSSLTSRASSPSHALVFWVEEKRHSVIPLKDVQNDGAIVMEGQTFRVKFGKATKSKPNPFYEAKILVIGSLVDCQASEKVMPIVSPLTSTRVSAKPKGGFVAKASEPEFDQNDFLIAEVQDLKEKLKTMSTLLDSKDQKFKRLEEEFLALESKHIRFMNSFNGVDKEKYIKMAKQTLAIFGTQADVEESHMVSLA
jgi:hypothetical protein